ncbi:hypothetical protein GCM10025855_01130 [Shewanella glacialipiscicola]|uniref:Peptidase M13 N-terminal domain-containing protein n=1 Tax=Shewanella glacialipiscicola TaxID=614069 RepID=A0ABQ6IXG2_9GAMM|nr:hypothetical protein GCM10025855_01130 [Shewanella glacialipiscicola]
MKKISTLALGIALGLGLAACSTEPKTEVAAVSGIELQNFDTSVRHQDDFYYSVNGKWLANTPIPADKSNYGAFSVLYDQSQDALKKSSMKQRLKRIQRQALMSRKSVILMPAL